MDKGPASRLAPRSERPAPLPLLFVALGLWSGAAAAYQYAAGLSPGVLWCILAAGLALAGVGIGVYAKAGGAKAEVVSLVALGLGLGLACGSFAGLSAQARAESLQGQAAATYRFEIVEDVHDGSFSRTARARTVLDDGRVFSVRLVFKGKDSDVAFGDCIDATTTLRPPSAGAAGFYWQQGIDAVADVRAFEARERDGPLGVLVGVRKAAIALVEEQEAPGGALLTAILMGERSALNASGLYADIRVVGLAHLVAVSGAHLVIVGSFLASLLRLARVPRVAALVIQVLFIGIYLVFTGMQVSALRAACMTVVATLSFFARRRASSMNALAVCIIAMVVASPATSVSISFVLSAGSTLSIVVLGRLFSNWFSSTVPRAPAIVRENASLCLASSVVVMPLTAALFSQMSLISPVANIVAAPLFAFLCTGGLVAVCLSLALPSLAGVLLAPLLGASQGFCEMVSLIARVPYAAIPAHAGVVPAVLLSLALFFALWYAWPRPSKAGALGASLGLAALALAAVAATPFLSSDELVMLNVGQGDAFLVKSRGSCVLVDTGMNDRQLLSGLARHSAYTIDTVVITHPDYDHMGSLDALCGIVRVKRVCLAEPLFTCGCESCEDLLASA
ncbi:MAG: ComEC/Rec2 family competence protein, partial [Coriobacteriaceae bacterium]|nr:ComEC/Rec2 family competence protein [Coriobacteriaceae bacterium]